MATPLRKLNIETSSRCNLSCHMCVRSAWSDAAGHMSWDTYRRLLPAFHQLSSVNLSGYGEPLLNEHIIEMISEAKANLPRDAQVGFNTNATGIDGTMATALVASGLDTLVVSIDGTSPRTFRGVRTGADLGQVLGNIEKLNAAKERLGSRPPALGFEFVAMKANLGELPSLVRMANEYRASFVLVTHLLPHTEDLRDQVLYDANSDLSVDLFEAATLEAGGDGKSFIRPEFLPYIYGLFGLPPLKGVVPDVAVSRHLPDELERSLQLVERTIQTAVKDKVVLNFSRLLARDAAGLSRTENVFAAARSEAERLHVCLSLPPLLPRARRECGFIKNGTAFVSWDGHVRPCNNLSHTYTCYIGGRRKKVSSVSFGSVLEQELLDIWNSEKYAEFRQRTERFDFPPCGDCNYNEACNFIIGESFEQDCYLNPQPCGDCLWSRGVLQCL